MKTNLRKMVFNLLDQGKTREEILEILKFENKQTVNNYICKYPKRNEDLTTINDKQKNIFLDLEKGLSSIDICNKYGICSATLDNTYKSLYRKFFNVAGKRNLDFSKLNFAHTYYNIEKENIHIEKNENTKIDNIATLLIGSNKYDLSFYVFDETIWFNFIEILTSLKNENISFDKDEIQISERYLKTMQINNQEVTLIDKNILLSFANDIGDHTFIKAVIDLTVTNKNIFYKISSFVDSVNTMSDLVKNYIETGNSKLLVFEKMETDALHYMENNELSDEELLKEAKHIKNIRLKRREFKNIFVLSGKAKGIICENGSHSEALRDIANKLDLLAKDLYNKTYICRSELTEQEKKDILN